MIIQSRTCFVGPHFRIRKDDIIISGPNFGEEANLCQQAGLAIKARISMSEGQAMVDAGLGDEVDIEVIASEPSEVDALRAQIEELTKRLEDKPKSQNKGNGNVGKKTQSGSDPE